MLNVEYTKMSERINSNRAEEFFDDESIRDVKTDFMGRLVTIVIAALGLITALAWDRTLEDIFTNFFGPLNSLSRKITYAVAITLLAVAVTIILRRLFIKKEKGRRARRHQS